MSEVSDTASTGSLVWSRVRYGEYRSSIGTVRRMRKGWRFYPNGRTVGSEPFPTMRAVKAFATSGIPVVATDAKAP